MLITIALLVVLAVMASAQIPCDDAYGQHCPEAAGWEVGECLKKVEADLPQDCKNYITMTETCKADIETHCTGKEYTGDALVCLSDWTKPEQLSAECLAALPKKQSTERKLSDEEKKKAAKRRKA